MKGRFQKQHNAPLVVSEDQTQFGELETAASVPENNDDIAQDIPPASNSSVNLSGSNGKPGLVSFYNRPHGRDTEFFLSNSEKSQNSILWFMGPAVLVASFIFPSLYLRKLLSIIFEDSLLTGKFSLEDSLVFVHFKYLMLSCFDCDKLYILLSYSLYVECFL